MDAFVSKISAKLGTMIEEEVAMLLNVSDEINELRHTLLTIQDVLADAERKRIESQLVSNWLNELKDIMYDADDILDECYIDARSESSVRFHCSLSSCFRELIFTDAIGRKIRSLNRRLENILARRSKLDLRISSPDNIPVATSQISRQKSPVESCDIVGTRINEDARNLVDSLTTTDDRAKLLVFGITGIGGVGKTTLAQKIYNDDKIKVSFPIRIWLCVSREFSEDNLLRELITSAGDDHRRALTKASLELMVEEVLRDKVFLLVPDDVWNDNVWFDLLRDPLQGAAAGSRVLVTTRNEGVARGMTAVHTQRVELLSPEDGWSLLCKKVVLGGDDGQIEWLKDIGMQIVKKCDGLPLAITTVGRLLSEKERSKRAWQRVLNSTEWSCSGLPEGVHQALYLSYMDLPSNLKQCFLYCSLFKEDALTDQRSICSYWIAEGFITAEGNLTLEETAEEYYRELVRRSLLQPDPRYYDFSAFKVHDLLRSLAQFLVRDENLYVTWVGSESNADTLVKLRRLSITAPVQGVSMIPDMIRKHSSLRTLLLNGVQIGVDDDLCGSAKCLRVLVLNHATVGRLPLSIGNLKHLRLLEISDARITEVPPSIGDLSNLQFLFLRGCINLRNLPKSIVRLRNLRSLLLGSQTQVEGMPVGLRGLQHLQVLTFFVGRGGDIRESANMEGEWCGLEELSDLPHLRELFIYNLEEARIDDDTRVRMSAINTKQHLEVLRLRCSSAATSERIEEVFEWVLSPPHCLQILSVDCFLGHDFPRWIEGSYLPNLRRLDLVDCKLCRQLPALGTLPSLDFLRITGALAITTIGPEFLGQEGGVSNQEVHRRPSGSSSSHPAHAIFFPRLEHLFLENMPNWEEWQWDVEDGEGMVVFPCLKQFRLLECPSLRSLPSGFYSHATTLTALAIVNASSLEALESLPSVKSLEIYDRTQLERVAEFSNLEVLELGSYYIQYIPQWLIRGREHFPALRKLQIIGRAQLLQRCLRDGPDWPAIEYISNVSGRTSDGSYYFSYTKSPSSFTTNLDHSIRRPW